MAKWNDFASAEPDFSRRVLELFTTQKHMTLATLRRDGSPRISGTEAQFVDDELVLGMMPGSLKARDLLRDPRMALHSPSIDPPEGDPSAWGGDAKIAGVAVENFDKDAYRAVYCVSFSEAIYVLHAFQKKSPKGRKTAKDDVEMVARRLKLARQMHEKDHGKEK